MFIGEKREKALNIIFSQEDTYKQYDTLREILNDKQYEELKKDYYFATQVFDVFPVEDTLEMLDRCMLDDKRFMLEVVRKDGLLIEYASKRLQEDYSVAYNAIKQNALALYYTKNEKIFADKEILSSALDNHDLALSHIDPRYFKDDRELLLKACSKDGEILSRIAKNYKSDIKELSNDKEIILTALGANFNDNVLTFASEELQNDKDIVEKVYQIGKMELFSQLGKDVRNDKKTVMKFLEKSQGTSALLIYEGLDLLRDDEEIYRYALNKSKRGYILSNAGQKILKNRELLIETLKVAPDAFKYLPEDLQNDKDIILMLLSLEDAASFNVPFMIDEKMLKDRDIAEAVISADGCAITELPIEYSGNRDFAFKAVTTTLGAFKFIAEKFRSDKNFVMDYLAVAKKTSSDKRRDSFFYAMLDNVAGKLKDDKEVVKGFIDIDASEFIYASDKMKNDAEIVKFALKKDIYLYNWVGSKLKNNLKFLNWAKEIAEKTTCETKENSDKIEQVKKEIDENILSLYTKKEIEENEIE